MVTSVAETGLPAVNVYLGSGALDEANHALTELRFDSAVIAHYLATLTQQPDIAKDGVNIVLYGESDFDQDDDQIFDVAYLGREKTFPTEQELGGFVLGVYVDAWDSESLAYGLADAGASLLEEQRAEKYQGKREQRLQDGTAVFVASTLPLISEGFVKSLVPGAAVGTAFLLAYAQMRRRDRKKQAAVAAEVNNLPLPLDNKGQPRLPFTALPKYR